MITSEKQKCALLSVLCEPYYIMDEEIQME